MNNTIDGNQAKGAAAVAAPASTGSGGAGGAGQGGGLFVTIFGALALTDDTIEGDQADGGSGGGSGGLGGASGANGQGIGGGVIWPAPARPRPVRRSPATPPPPAIITSMADSDPEPVGAAPRPARGRRLRGRPSTS